MSESIDIQREPLPPLPALEREWRALERVAGRGFFLSWSWIGTWLATLPPGIEPFVLRAQRGGATLGIALAVERPATRALYLNAMGDHDLDAIYIEHNGFLCEMSADHAVLNALAAWFAQSEPPLDALHLPGIAASARRGKLIEDVRDAPGFAMNLARVAEAGGDVGAVLSGKVRQQLRRAVRAYEARGTLELSEAASIGEALAFFDAMKQLHIASWQRRRRRHAFASPHFERFHRALIEREFGNGAIQLLRIAVGGAAIGYLYNFRNNGIVYAYQSGFDDGHRGLSPGVVSHALALAHNAKRGERLYDFLAGANRLKENFATNRYRLVWQVLHRPRLDHRLRAAARHIKRKIAG
ncbi:MAG TPA: GNAT family N-acetyltransferase [Stellaceae bacterium]|nr:GNAT family N-acetyltransferase [Stellaceae bacterium]